MEEISKKIFISFCSEDKEIAKKLQGYLERFNPPGFRLDVWFSHDERLTGGVKTGTDWFQTILDKLNDCDMVIAVLTRNSKESPWVHYECGYAYALPNCELYPIRFDLADEDINKSPISHLQMHSLTKPDDLYSIMKEVYNMLGMNPREDDKNSTKMYYQDIAEHRGSGGIYTDRMTRMEENMTAIQKLVQEMYDHPLFQNPVLSLGDQVNSQLEQLILQVQQMDTTIQMLAPKPENNISNNNAIADAEDMKNIDAVDKNLQGLDIRLLNVTDFVCDDNFIISDDEEKGRKP